MYGFTIRPIETSSFCVYGLYCIESVPCLIICSSISGSATIIIHSSCLLAFLYSCGTTIVAPVRLFPMFYKLLNCVIINPAYVFFPYVLELRLKVGTCFVLIPGSIMVL
jgi:hypothetical protein